jgi:hypothetical protein
VATGILNRHHPSHIERVLRYVELAHCSDTQFVFGQVLQLVVLHERQQKVAALLPLLRKCLREFLTLALNHHVYDRNATTLRSGAPLGNRAQQSHSRYVAQSPLH